MTEPKLNRLQRDKFLLFTINHASPKLRKAILKYCPNTFIKTMSEICYNVLKGNCRLNDKALNGLKKYKKQIRYVACPSNSSQSKRTQLIQKGEGFLPILLAPLIIELFKNI